ncbi:MAG TPA: fibro-slime domain-containing protein [Polyangia bacterium]|nr:fibro-slime domain-containing protein [Polyangia bacterium]
MVTSACTWSPGAQQFGQNSGGGGGVSGGGNNNGGGGTISGAGGVPVGNGQTGGATFSGGGQGQQVPIPADFTNSDIGAYKVGDEILPNSGQIDSPADGCNKVIGVVRDFRGINEAMGHPDFEAYHGGDTTPGLLQAMLGSDRKPVYAGKCEKATTTDPDPPDCPYGPEMTTKTDFDEWYRTTANVNHAYQISFIFEPNNGVTTFQAQHFFPIDGLGFGNGPNNHNFGFTTELHTKFMYKGGEKFTFTGDDDLWVFVNKKLALDLGGLHPQVTGTIDMDAMATQLGLVKNTAYDIEMFHAERHTSESHFRVDTNFVFVNCGTIIP